MATRTAKVIRLTPAVCPLGIPSDSLTRRDEGQLDSYASGMLPLRFTLPLASIVASLPLLGLACGGRVTQVSSADAGTSAEAESPPVSLDAGTPAASCSAGLQSGAPWPMFGGDSCLSGRSSAIGPALPAVKWFFPAEITAQPAIAADGTIYFGTTDGTVYALNADGSVRWTYTDGPGLAFGGTPAIAADGTVVVGANVTGSGIAGIFALSPGGAFSWSASTSVPTSHETPSPAIGHDGTVYYSVAYRLYSVAAVGADGWQADAGGEYAIVPAVGPDGTVYVGGQNGLQAFTSGGKWLWTYGACAGLTSECASQPAVADDGTIVTTVASLSTGNGPAALLTAVVPDGAPAWSFPVEGLGVGSAMGADGTAFFPVDGQLTSVRSGGQPAWSARLAGDGGGGAPVIDGAGTSPCGLPCEHVSGAGLQAFHADGSPAWVWGANVAFASPAIGADGTLYAAALGGIPDDAGLTGLHGLYALGP
jgi:outer membrane protein assembly factor BamB